MPVRIKRILLEGDGASPTTQPVVITDQATSAVLATGMPDATGAFSIPLPFAEFLQAVAAAQAAAAGSLATPGAETGGAGGAAGGAGTLTQQLPLSGEADGAAGGGGTNTFVQGLAGTAGGGGGGGAGTPSQLVPGAMQGAAGGQAGASGAPVVNPGLSGVAAGKAAGTSPLVQAKPITGTAGGAGGASASGLSVAGGGSVSVTCGMVTTSTTTSISPPLPSAVTAGQTLIAIVVGGQPSNVPAGWGRRASNGNGAVYWRLATGSDPAPTFSGLAGGAAIKAVVLAVSGALSTMPTYAVGTVSGSAGSPILNGVSTAWTDANGVHPGDTVTVGGNSYTIATVNSATQLALASNLVGTFSAGSSYVITSDSVEAAASASNGGSDVGTVATYVNCYTVTTKTANAIMLFVAGVADLDTYAGGAANATIGTDVTGPATTSVLRSNGVVGTDRSTALAVWSGTAASIGATATPNVSASSAADTWSTFSALLAITPGA